jgi:ubiquinone/menaquinone biosynthesis C-methylase UbiE
MNENHAELCSSAEWAAHMKERFIDPLAARVHFGPSMLEIGPGPGAATERLRHLVPHLTVLEVDPDAAERLAKRYVGTNVEVVVGDAAAMRFEDGTFSAVASFTMLHHIPTVHDQDRVLMEAFRVLQPGGAFVGSDSLASGGLHAFHEGDTYNPVEPSAFFTRLRMAGFDRIALEADDALTFVAVKARSGGEGECGAASGAAGATDGDGGRGSGGGTGRSGDTR